MIEETLAEDIPAAIKDGGLIRDGVDGALDEARELSTDGKTWLLRYESEQKDLTGIGSLKGRYTKVFGYYIEVSKANVHLVPAEYVRKQTLVNAERYLLELKEYERKYNLQKPLYSRETFHFERLRAVLMDNGSRVSNTVCQSQNWMCQCPRGPGEGKGILSSHNEPLKGFHPIGQAPCDEDLMGEGYFIPNDVQMDASHRNFLLITGPNMAGKSTVMRQVALIGLMAQVGSFVPASSATLGIIDRFTRVGASDNLSRGQSTFISR